MIVGLSGYGYTGSGAVTDFLKEFSDNQVLDKFEFSFIYKPDGIEDLEYHLVKHPTRFFSSDVAIRRFYRAVNANAVKFNMHTDGKFKKLAYEYIDGLIQVKWKGTSIFLFVENHSPFRLFTYMGAKLFREKFTDKLLKRNVKLPTDKMMYLSVKPQDFYERTKRFLNDIFISMGADFSKKVIVDQLFSPDNPESGFAYFDDPRSISVGKDPRDLYLLAKKVVLSRCLFIPTGSVEDFVAYYRNMMRGVNPDSDPQKVLRISFEDLIYEYDATTKKIVDFLGLKNHVFPKKYFDPQKSVLNTRLFEKYPEFNDEIKYIEKELKEYLYPFEKYDRIETDYKKHII